MALSRDIFGYIATLRPQPGAGTRVRPVQDRRTETDSVGLAEPGGQVAAERTQRGVDNYRDSPSDEDDTG